MINILVNVVLALFVFTIFSRQFVAARIRYLEWEKNRDESPVMYFMSNAIGYTIIPFVLVFVTQMGLITSIFSIITLLLGIWHFYFLYKYYRNARK